MDAIRSEEQVLLLLLLLLSLIITLSRLGSLPTCPVPQDVWLRVGSFPPQGIPDSEPRAERQTAPPCHSIEAHLNSPSCPCSALTLALFPPASLQGERQEPVHSWQVLLVAPSFALMLW